MATLYNHKYLQTITAPAARLCNKNKKQKQQLWFIVYERKIQKKKQTKKVYKQ